MLSARAVWTVLERYYELRRSYPISSPLAGVGGASRASSGGIPEPLVFLADVGGVLEGLTERQRELVEAAHITRRAAHDAEMAARNADRSVMWTSVKDVRDARMRSRREWRSIARTHQQELRRITQRKAYSEAMDVLCADLEHIVLLRQLARVLAAV